MRVEYPKRYKVFIPSGFYIVYQRKPKTPFTFLPAHKTDDYNDETCDKGCYQAARSS